MSCVTSSLDNVIVSSRYKLKDMATKEYVDNLIVKALGSDY